MENPKKCAEKRKNEIASQNQAKKKQRGDNWTQNDTNLLCNLLVKFGAKGILSKETNGATNKMKKNEWDVIRAHFNADPTIKTQREVEALIARHKKIMSTLRLQASHDRQSALQTGGGPANSTPSLKIDLKGEMLQLKSFYGHLLCGLESYDSDITHKDTQRYNEEPSAINSLLPSASLPSPTHTQSSSLLSETSPVIDVATDTVPDLVEQPQLLGNSGCSNFSGTNVNTTSLEGSQAQFFITTSQNKSKSSKKTVDLKNINEMRMQMINEERIRLAESHELRLKCFREEHAERISEIHQRTALLAKQNEFWQEVTDAFKKNRKDNVHSKILEINKIGTIGETMNNAQTNENCNSNFENILSEALRFELCSDK